MTIASVTTLLKENESELLRERRSADRRPFVRPVTVTPRKNGELPQQQFSRDISPVGIGLIGKVAWQAGTVAVLSVHSLTRRPVDVTAEVRWCKPYGEGWFQTGWSFLREGS